MSSVIDKIITLEDGTKYMVLDAIMYQEKPYLLVNTLDTNGDLINHFTIFSEAAGVFTSVQDPELLKSLSNIFKGHIKY